MAKKGGTKGRKKQDPDNDNPELNPLLHVDNSESFTITTSNLLQDPTALIMDGFEKFEWKDDKITIDYDRFNERTVIVIVLRYYEYICIAETRFDYLLPLLDSGLTGKQVFEMICHCLKNRLLSNVPSFDTVFEPDISYIGKIKYYN